MVAWCQCGFLLIYSLVIYGLYLALYVVPPDYQQGDSARILYIHVPAAILAQSCYMLMAAAGVVLLVRLLHPAPAHGLSHLDACLIAIIWHLPLTAFIYWFVGRSSAVRDERVP